MKKKHAGKAKRLSMDIISTLPQPIIESILSLLPTRVAARTSILSRDWRYKWTTVPKLELYHYGGTTKKVDTRCTYFNYTHRVLLMHQGPIQELTLRMCEDCDCFELDLIILHLAKNHTVKKLALHGWDFDVPFDLPKSVYSLHYLTDLVLSYADLEHQPMFNGFGNLRSLVLNDARISTKTLLHLLSNCPSLKSFELAILMGETHFGERCTIVELFKCLPVIEHLTIDKNSLLFWLDLGLVPRELPSFLFHLKYFFFILMSFFDNYGLPFLLALIKCSPNLEKLKIDIEWADDYDEEYTFLWEKYSDVRLENLIELEILCLRILKVEMEFVKFILARAPKLKKLSICNGVISGQGRSKMIEVLLKALRASKEKSKTLEVVLQAPSAAALVRIYV